jgi:mannitol/fructose-specific phosphotransferase system IIA component (Ntr-type)
MDINILDYIKKDSVVFGLKAKNKKAVFTIMLDALIAAKQIASKDKTSILKTLIKREEMGSTAIGGRIAFPHARISMVKDLVLCVAISSEGVDFDSLDQEPVNVISLLLSNQKEAGLHLKMLAFLARMLRDKYFMQQLRDAKAHTEVFALLNKQQQAVR